MTTSTHRAPQRWQLWLSRQALTPSRSRNSTRSSCWLSSWLSPPFSRQRQCPVDDYLLAESGGDDIVAGGEGLEDALGYKGAQGLEKDVGHQGDAAADDDP